MAGCVVCEVGDQFLFPCEHCDLQFCKEHRPPEAHRCEAAPASTGAGEAEPGFIFGAAATSDDTGRPASPWRAASRYVETGRERVPSLPDRARIVRRTRHALPNWTLGELSLPQYDRPNLRRWSPTSKSSLLLVTGVIVFGIVIGVVLFGGAINGALASGIGSGPSDGGAAAAVNQTAVERLVVGEMNVFREANDVDSVTYDTQLASIAEYHSEDMAARNYTGHVGPDGETIEDRFERYDHGCDAAGELILVTQFGSDMDANDETIGDDTESDLAGDIVERWRDSAPHREALLTASWTRAGVGVHVTPADRVYVTLNAC